MKLNYEWTMIPRLDTRWATFKAWFGRFLAERGFTTSKSFEKMMVNHYTSRGWMFFSLPNNSGTYNEFVYRFSRECHHYLTKVNPLVRHFVFQNVPSIDRRKNLLFIKLILEDQTYGEA